MADVFDKAKRSRIMASITAKDTKPEMTIRKALHRNGYRYRLHDRTLPGTPDLTFRKFKAVIMVHGCFWHGHDCTLFRMPATNQKYWSDKISNNQKRDQKVRQELLDLGWRVLIIWECSMKGRHRTVLDDLIPAIENWLLSDHRELEISGGSSISGAEPPNLHCNS
ncbi:MAG: very short patch repair endonuclease [Acidiferrobacterales bacterium]|nr:very short patch repair endonuclease [Acidiferrobacterales bacterium]